jgi:PPOX class probable F420-dependent enzyme
MSPKLPKVAKGLVDGKNFGFLSTIMDDGSPQVTPVWVDREGETILVNTVMGRTKQKNMTRDPRVALAIVNWESPYTWVQIRGKVVSQSAKGASKHIDRLSKKYLGLEKYPGTDRKRLLVRITPQKVAWNRE